ncbi:MAG: DUF2231 domain-containing protein [Phycisphaerales bacterium]
MRCTLFLAVAVAFVPALAAQATYAQTPPADDLPSRVRAVLAAHCSECHAETLARPKGRFGYVTDLPRLVAEAQVVPGQPDESPLFELLAHDDPEFRMPPRTAKAGPLSTEQIELVRAWIAAGAPAPADRDSASPPATPPTVPAVAPSAAPPTPPAAPRSIGDRAFAFVGKFHPVIVHFPIALLIVAAFAELLVMGGWRAGRETNRLLVPLGALSAVIAVVIGLIAASAEGFTVATVWTHRLLGILAAACAVLALAFQALLKERLYRVFLFVAAALTGLAGHFGGLITFGDDHFSF